MSAASSRQAPQPNVAEQLSDGLISALAAMLLAHAQRTLETPQHRGARKASKPEVPS